MNFTKITDLDCNAIKNEYISNNYMIVQNQYIFIIPHYLKVIKDVYICVESDMNSDDIFDEIKLDIGGNQIDNYDFCFQEFLEYYYKVYTKKTKIKDNKYLIEVPILFDVFVKSMLAIPHFTMYV